MKNYLRSGLLAVASLSSAWACTGQVGGPAEDEVDGLDQADDDDRGPSSGGTSSIDPGSSGGMGGDVEASGGSSPGTGGTSTSACDPGEQDHDGDGSCSAECASANLSCGANQECDDSTGTAGCVCSFGFQDSDENGTCEPGCGDDTCSSNGTCSELTGTVACECAPFHAGADCSTCDDDGQDLDGDGRCSATCAAAALDCEIGTECSDASGTAECVCAPDWQDEDGDGTCSESCAATSCGDNSTCSHETGTALCGCAPGYELSDVSGECVETCASSALECPSHASCTDAAGFAECSCDPGYQDNDDNTTCEADCGTAALSCGGNAECGDESGEALCACLTGYEAMDQNGDCTSCIAGELSLDTTLSGTTAGATDTILPSCGSIYDSLDVTYSFTAGARSSYQFSTVGSGFDTVISVHDGASCSGDELTCNDDVSGGGGSSRVSLVLEEGQRVNVVVNGYDGSEFGSYELRAIKDPCEDALDLGSTLGDNLASLTLDSAVAYRADCGTERLAPEHYFKWTAPETKSYVITTDGSSYDTVLYPVVGCDMNLSGLVCNDDGGVGLQSSITRAMTAGETLIFIVDSWLDYGSGTSVININEAP